MPHPEDMADAIGLLRQFLAMQDYAYESLKTQFPNEKIDLYQDRLQDLFANLSVLMYYQITPSKLEVLLNCYKTRPYFKLFDEDSLQPVKLAKIIDQLEILLYKQGQVNSLREDIPVDARGQPIPWITYPALEFLSQFDYSGCNIFEFGAGNSTLYWAARAKTVTAIETDFEWYKKLKGKKPENVDLLFRDDVDGFTNAVRLSPLQYSMIIIDSIRYRYNATVSAITNIAPGGLIVFDNSDWYPNSCKLLRETGFIQIDFHGFGAVNAYAWTTSIFFKESINFNRLAEGLHPVGGIVLELEDDRPR
ncbi:O-methyltransferase [Thiobacillus sp.]